MADLSTRPAAGRVATVLVLGAAAAALGQWCFARGHALVGGQYERSRRLADRGAAGVRRGGGADGAPLSDDARLGGADAAPRRRRDRHPPRRRERRRARSTACTSCRRGCGSTKRSTACKRSRSRSAASRCVALPPEDVRTGLGAGFVDVAALVYAWGDPDDGRWAVRAVAAVLGTLGVAAAAALAWTWFGPLAAIAATGWLAVSQWHVNYSRWGEMPIMSPLLETVVALGVTLGVRATSWRGRCGWLLAGAALGAGLYTYQTFRLWAPMALAARCRRRDPPSPRAARSLVRDRRGAVAGGADRDADDPLHAASTRRTSASARRGRSSSCATTGASSWRSRCRGHCSRSSSSATTTRATTCRSRRCWAGRRRSSRRSDWSRAPCAGGRRRMRRPCCGSARRWCPPIITLEAPHATRLLDTIVPVALMIGVAVERGAAAVRGGVAAPRRGARSRCSP